MTDEITVQIGTPEDLDQLMALAFSACEENGFLPPNQHKILQEIWSALNQHYGLIGVIKNETGLIEGAILMRIGDMWYSDQMVLEERGIFIHPDYRSAKGGRAKKLCEFAKQVSENINVPLVIGILSNSRTEAKVRLYKRQFGEPTGAFFLYGARTGEAHVTEH